MGQIKISEQTAKYVELKKHLSALYEEVLGVISEQYSDEDFKQNFEEPFNSLDGQLSKFMIASIDEHLGTLENKGEII